MKPNILRVPAPLVLVALLLFAQAGGRPVSARQVQPGEGVLAGEAFGGSSPKVEFSGTSEDLSSGVPASVGASAVTIWKLSFDSPLTEIKSLVAYDNRLFAGGHRSSQTDAHLYSFDGVTWTDTDFAARVGATVDMIEAFQVFNGALYIGTRVDVMGVKYARVYRYDGTVFALDFSTPARSGYSGIEDLAVHANALYAASGCPNGGVYRRNGSNDWVSLGAPEINGSTRALASYNGSLYAGTSFGPNMAAVWRWNGTRWDLAINLVTAFKLQNDGVWSLAAFDGKLFVGLAGSANVPTPIPAYDGTTWAISTKLSGCGSARLSAATTMLWVGTCSSQVYRYDGQSWLAEGSTGATGVFDIAEYRGFVFAGTSASGNIYYAVAPTSGACDWSVLAPHAIVLVHGWGGPANDRLADDDQMAWFKYKPDGQHGDWIGPAYQEGCNLYYATGVNGQNSLLDNAFAIHQTVTRLVSTMASAPGWNRHFDIIAHSYGGINARAYLELYYPGDWGSYYDVDVRDLGIHVDNLFSLGSPLGGARDQELGLPGAVYIAGGALGSGRLSSAIQLLAGQMDDFNQQNSQYDQYGQDRGTCYRLISGNMNEQALPAAMPPPVREWFELFNGLPHDAAVSRRSAQILAETRFLAKYPHVRQAYTADVHGYIQPWGLNTLRSYVYPGDASKDLILPYLGAGIDQCAPRMVQSQTDRRDSAGADLAAPAILVLATGTITNGQTSGGIFDLPYGERSLMMLRWPEGDLNLSLQDPAGNIITPQQPNSVYARLDLGLASAATYAFTNTLRGRWTYTVTGGMLPYTMPFTLFGLPDSPIALRASAPEWLPFGSEVPITASITYSGIVVPGAVVTAGIQRPDGTRETLALLDDGKHDDGAADDGIYGNRYNASQSGFYVADVYGSGSHAGETYSRSALEPFTVGTSGAALTSHYRDFARPRNGTGPSEALYVEVGIAATNSASRTLSADLVGADGTYIALAKAAVPSVSGAVTATLAFGGEAIRRSGLNGPYRVANLVLSQDDDFASVPMVRLQNAWTTATYDYRQFGRLSYQVRLPYISGGP